MDRRSETCILLYQRCFVLADRGIALRSVQGEIKMWDYDDEDFGDQPESTAQYALGVIFGIVVLGLAIWLEA